MAGFYLAERAETRAAGGRLPFLGPCGFSRATPCPGGYKGSRGGHEMRTLALIATAAVLVVTSPAAAAGKRNVVLIVADDHGRDLGCYGNKEVRTPHLDRLAADG